ncbi:MAG: hypothetical protein EA355_10790 [Rhodobacteraceae bacterium]|nr:MAG: hypothetical protein EA355_10790 [Paracoccaceae bacterium]
MPEGATAIDNAERVIEVLVAENLAASKPFYAWFMRRFMEDSAPNTAQTERAVSLSAVGATASHGAAIEIVTRRAEARCVIVVAVATFPDVGLAAAARAVANAAKQAHEAESARTLLLTPGGAARAGDAGAPFDAVAGLEEAHEVFDAGAAAASGEMGVRMAFQRQLFRDALEALSAATAGAKAPAKRDVGGQDFREGYLAMLGRVAPQLRLRSAPEPGRALEKVTFAEDVLPKWGFMPRPRLTHHVREGAATLLIDGWGGDIEGLATIMEPAFANTEYKLAIAPAYGDGRRPGVRIIERLPSLDPEGPFEPQAEDAQAAIEATLDLRNWFARRQAAARYWAEHVDPSFMVGAVSRISRESALD